MSELNQHCSQQSPWLAVLELHAPYASRPKLTGNGRYLNHAQNGAPCLGCSSAGQFLEVSYFQSSIAVEIELSRPPEWARVHIFTFSPKPWWPICTSYRSFVHWNPPRTYLSSSSCRSPADWNWPFLIPNLRHFSHIITVFSALSYSDGWYRNLASVTQWKRTS